MSIIPELTREIDVEELVLYADAQGISVVDAFRRWAAVYDPSALEPATATPSEATALGMAIEEMEKPAALERRNAQLKNVGASFGSRDPNEGEDIRPRDIAAEADGAER